MNEPVIAAMVWVSLIVLLGTPVIRGYNWTRQYFRLPDAGVFAHVSRSRVCYTEGVSNWQAFLTSSES